MGLRASLTLGNHKSVDVIVVVRPGVTRTIDVKGSSVGDWYAKNIDGTGKRSHFFVFVHFSRIGDLNRLPECFVVPAAHIDSLVDVDRSGRRKVRLRHLRARKTKYLEQWQRLQ